MNCNLKNVEVIIEHHLKSLWETKINKKLIPPILMTGPPGIGKSHIIESICKKHNIGFIDIRLSQREPVDMRGLPVPILGEEKVKWLLNSEYPRDPNSKGIIFFDELTACDRTLQVAAYEFILDRRLGDSYKVPDGWYICAAGNGSNDRAVYTTISSALANRFCHLEINPNLKTWIKWALNNNIHPMIISFLRFKPDNFFDMSGDVQKGWPSPRSWERVSVELFLAETMKLDKLERDIIITGLVGKGAGIELEGYLLWADKLPDVEKMLNGEIAIKIPKRADQRYALCSALVHYFTTAENPQDIVDNFLDILVEMTSDFAILAMTDILKHIDDDNAEERIAAIFCSESFETFQNKHGAVLR